MSGGHIDDDKVCVVAASSAWPFYLLAGAYVCQEYRYLQEDAGRLGFYSSRLIRGVAPRIVAIEESVTLDSKTAASYALDIDPETRRFGEVIDACIEQGWSDPAAKIVLLTTKDDPDTATFEPIRHNGKTAWTMKQRYASLERLHRATSTEDLVDSNESEAGSR